MIIMIDGVVIAVHYAKFKAGGLGHVFGHYARVQDDKGEYIAYKRHTHIDNSQTHLNYNLGPERTISQYQFLKKRLDEVYIFGRNGKKQNEIIRMCDWVITLPRSVKDGDERKFFENVYEFFSKKYGVENVVSAYVHNDETTPHLHFSFVPVVDDEKRGEKLCANDCVTRVDLQTIHKEVEAFISDKMGYSIEMYKVSSDDDREHEKRNKSIAELKAKSAEKKILQEAEKKATALIQKAEETVKSRLKVYQPFFDRQYDFDKVKQSILNYKSFKTKILDSDQHIITDKQLGQLSNILASALMDDEEFKRMDTKRYNAEYRLKEKEKEFEWRSKIADDVIVDLRTLIRETFKCGEDDLKKLDNKDKEFLAKYIDDRKRSANKNQSNESNYQRINVATNMYQR